MGAAYSATYTMDHSQHNSDDLVLQPLSGVTPDDKLLWCTTHREGVDTGATHMEVSFASAQCRSSCCSTQMNQPQQLPLPFGQPAASTSPWEVLGHHKQVNPMCWLGHQHTTSASMQPLHPGNAPSHSQSDVGSGGWDTLPGALPFGAAIASPPQATRPSPTASHHPSAAGSRASNRNPFFPPPHSSPANSPAQLGSLPTPPSPPSMTPPVHTTTPLDAAMPAPRSMPQWSMPP